MSTNPTPPSLNTISTKPTLRDLLDEVKRDIFLSLNCHALATVQSFNAAEQTIVAQFNYASLYYKANSDGSTSPYLVEYPPLVDVPVLSLCGGQTALTFPIAKGDQCLILFNDRDINNWVAGAGSGALASNRLHSLADGIALVGLNDISSYDTIRALLTNGTVKLGINPETNKVTITNGTSLNTLLSTLISHLQSLITQVAAITVTAVTSGGGVSGPPANAAAITAISAQLSTDASNIAELLE